MQPFDYSTGKFERRKKIRMNNEFTGHLETLIDSFNNIHILPTLPTQIVTCEISYKPHSN